MARPVQTLGTRVRRLLELLDGDVARLYREAGFDYRPRYTPVMRLLLRSGPASIGDLAEASGLTQPAVSQTVAQMHRDGLVAYLPSRDRRRRLVGLTAHGKAMGPALERQWAATLAAAEALDGELPMPLSDLIATAVEALEARPFADRIRAEMHGDEMHRAEPQPTGDERP